MQEKRQKQTQRHYTSGVLGRQTLDGAGNVIGDRGVFGLGSQGSAVLSGASAGALAGASIGWLGGPVGIAIGTAVGAAIGGATGYFMAPDSTTGLSRNQRDIHSYANDGWATSATRQARQDHLQDTINRHNEERSKVENAKFQALMADVDGMSTAMKTFGDVLPHAALREFQDVVEGASGAAAKLAQAEADMDNFNRLSRMSDTMAAKEAQGQTKRGWFWDMETYSAVIGTGRDGQDIIATGKTEKEFNENRRRLLAENESWFKEQQAAAHAEMQAQKNAIDEANHQLTLKGHTATMERKLVEQQIKDEGALMDLKRKHANELHAKGLQNLTESHKVELDAIRALGAVRRGNAEKIHTAELNAIEAIARAGVRRYASGRGATLESRRDETLTKFDMDLEIAKEQRAGARESANIKEQTELQKKQREETNRFEMAMMQKKQGRELALMKIKQNMEIELVRLQHEMRLAGIEEEHRKKQELERIAEDRQRGREKVQEGQALINEGTQLQKTHDDELAAARRKLNRYQQEYSEKQGTLLGGVRAEYLYQKRIPEMEKEIKRLEALQTTSRQEGAVKIRQGQQLQAQGNQAIETSREREDMAIERGGRKLSDEQVHADTVLKKEVERLQAEREQVVLQLAHTLGDQQLTDVQRAEQRTAHEARMKELDVQIEELREKRLEYVTAGSSGSAVNRQIAMIQQKGDEIQEVSQGFASEDQKDAIAQMNFQHEQASAVESLAHEQRMRDRADEHKYTLAAISERARIERELNREIIADKLRGELNRLDSQARVTSMSNQAELAKSMLSSKSGMERMPGGGGLSGGGAV